MTTVEQPPMTVEQFVRLAPPEDGSRLELVKGELVVMPPPKGRYGVCCSNVSRLLGNFAEAHRLGWVTTNDTGVIWERGPDTLRGPHVAFWRIERQPEVPDGYFLLPPDLAVEVLSPDDRPGVVRAKIKQYVFYGVPLVWLIDPDPEVRTVRVYAGQMRGTELGEEDRIDGGDVLPGFACPVAALFA
jgi:Uma2 family endonuclease